MAGSAVTQPIDPPPDPLAVEEPSRTNPPSFTLYFENDGTFVRPNGNTDRHYTSGQGFSFAWHRTGGDALAEALDLPAEGTAAGLILAQQIFTPSRLDLAFPPTDDRPYAGYLFLGGFWQRQFRGTLDHVQLDVGVVGPSSGAEAVQEWVHDIFAEVDPDWRTQLGDEVAVNFTYRRKWRIDLWTSELMTLDDGVTPRSVYRPQRWGWQLIPEVGLDVGTVYRRAHVGAATRFGFNLPDDFGPARLTDVGSATGRPVDGLSTYAFVKATTRYVEWNTFIEGSYQRDPSPAVSLEPFLSEFAGGFAVDWRRGNWLFGVDYTQTFFTREFEEQTTNDVLGSLAVRARYEF
ncbi:MAG: lipid A deacylase LpxR family protein [Planctomycetota bacterium]